MPETSSVDRAIKTAEELAAALNNQAPAALFHSFGDATLDVLEELSNMFSIHIIAKKGRTMPE